MRDMAPMVIAWLLSIGVLVVQRDLGSAILFFGLFILMIYVATARISWVIIGLLMVVVGGVFAALTMGHVERRVNVWLNAFDPEIYQARGGSAQIVEGLFGMADGGLFGTGLGGGSARKTEHPMVMGVGKDVEGGFEPLWDALRASLGDE